MSHRAFNFSWSSRSFVASSVTWRSQPQNLHKASRRMDYLSNISLYCNFANLHHCLITFACRNIGCLCVKPLHLNAGVFLCLLVCLQPDRLTLFNGRVFVETDHNECFLSKRTLTLISKFWRRSDATHGCYVHIPENEHVPNGISTLFEPSTLPLPVVHGFYWIFLSSLSTVETHFFDPYWNTAEIGLQKVRSQSPKDPQLQTKLNHWTMADATRSMTATHSHLQFHIREWNPYPRSILHSLKTFKKVGKLIIAHKEITFALRTSIPYFQKGKKTGVSTSQEGDSECTEGHKTSKKQISVTALWPFFFTGRMSLGHSTWPEVIWSLWESYKILSQYCHGNRLETHWGIAQVLAVTNVRYRLEKDSD